MRRGHLERPASRAAIVTTKAGFTVATWTHADQTIVLVSEESPDLMQTLAGWSASRLRLLAGRNRASHAPRDMPLPLRPFAPVILALLASIVIGHAEPRTFSSAETPATLLELFTSEGCSSCPPAEEWMSQLKKSPELWKTVVPVVFHVDYWDGLGWPDRFASREFTARQRRYAAAWKNGSVYTPGFVARGLEWKGFFQRGNLPASPPNEVGKLSVTLPDASRAEVVFQPNQPAPNALQVWIALLGTDLASDVKRGENRGRKLRHDFVVLRLQSAPLTFAEGRWTATLALPAESADKPTALAAWVAVGEAQPPLQATGGWLR